MNNQSQIHHALTIYTDEMDYEMINNNPNYVFSSN